jgi:flagellar basal-body rod modification protein FlgD
MSTVPAVSSSTAATASSSAALSSTAISNEESGDRFLKLLVTQLQNQDPMNPMDNAQLTSQMAQINTVAGIEKLNTSVGAMSDRLSAQLMNSQALQGASMVGRQVWTEGTTLSVEGGKGIGAFELPRAASAVSVDVLSSSGAVIGKVDLGAQASGRRTFQWSVPEGTNPSGLSFRVNAMSGQQVVQATPQSADRVTAVTAGPDGLVLQLSLQGATPVNKVKAWS